MLRLSQQSRIRPVVPGPFMLVVVGIQVALCSFASGQVSGDVRIDGSSTVAPISMAAAELFMAEHRGRVRVTVGISGTGGGFKKFLDQDADLRTHISDASRVIKPSELERAERLGIRFIEVPIGMDGIAVTVNPSITFCDALTVEELRRIWEPNSSIVNWRQVRRGFPDLPLKLYGPGTDSGTFDYFTEAIVGKAKASRSDYTASESDNVLVRGIAGDDGALGYFGFAYYEANKGKLKLLGVDNGSGPVLPSIDAIRSGAYQPLARPMFFYVNTEALVLPQVKAFLDYFFDHARMIVEHPCVNYVALSEDVYKLGRARLEMGLTGSPYGAAERGESLDKIYALP